jgi:hypothetical protein
VREGVHIRAAALVAALIVTALLLFGSVAWVSSVISLPVEQGPGFARWSLGFIHGILATIVVIGVYRRIQAVARQRRRERVRRGGV